MCKKDYLYEYIVVLASTLYVYNRFAASYHYIGAIFLTANLRENRRSNQEWTIQRNWQHYSGCTRRRSKTNKSKTTTQKTKKMSNKDHTKKGGGVNSGTPEWQAVSASKKTPTMLLI